MSSTLEVEKLPTARTLICSFLADSWLHAIAYVMHAAAGPYLAERYIKNDDPAWASAAAQLQASAGATKAAAVAGARRLAVVPVEAADTAVAGAQRLSDQQLQWQEQQPDHPQQWHTDAGLQQSAAAARQGSQAALQSKGARHQADRRRKRSRQLAAASQAGAAQRHGGAGAAAAAHSSKQADSQQQRRQLAAASQADAAAQGLRQQRAEGQAAALWVGVEQALLAAGPHAIQPPGVRTNAVDFVRFGVRMDR